MCFMEEDDKNRKYCCNNKKSLSASLNAHCGPMLLKEKICIIRDGTHGDIASRCLGIDDNLVDFCFLIQ